MTADASDSGRQVWTLEAPLDLTATAGATLHVRSWLRALDSRASVEASFDGLTWDTLHIVEASDTWVPIEIDLQAYAGRHVHIRFVFDAIAPADGVAPDEWRIDDVRVGVTP